MAYTPFIDSLLKPDKRDRRYSHIPKYLVQRNKFGKDFTKRLLTSSVTFRMAAQNMIPVSEQLDVLNSFLDKGLQAAEEHISNEW